jgi:hypothetical protein
MNAMPYLPARPANVQGNPYIAHIEQKLLLTLDARIHPMNLEQLFFVLQALRQISPDLGAERVVATAASCLAYYQTHIKQDSATSWSKFDAGGLKAVLLSVALVAPLMVQMQHVDMSSHLMGQRAFHAARPLCTACCACGSASLVERLCGLPTHFYAEASKSGPGQLIFLSCTTCGSVHHVDGFFNHTEQKVCAAEGSALQYPKRPYPPNLQHPRWFQSTTHSVFDKRLFARYDADLIKKQSSFLAFCEVEDIMQGMHVYLSSVHALFPTPSYTIPKPLFLSPVL